MPKDNITPFRNSNSLRAGSSVKLQSVIESVQTWRQNKTKLNEKIPDFIWDQVFLLLESLPESEILPALGISQLQLQNKRLDRQVMIKPSRDHQPPSQKSADTKSVEFCEATPKYPLAGKPAKAFDTTTCVVELYRPDGMLLKIHICTDSFDALLSAFFKGSF